MVTHTMVFILVAAVLLTAAVASALYVNSVTARTSNSRSPKNLTNATMAGNMTKKMTNMTGGQFKTTKDEVNTLIRSKPATPSNFIIIQRSIDP
jgi:TRAP-type mannitol/chloroaromatic compound transport system substrate-binding protein